MHIGLLSLEFGIIDYDLNRKTIFTLILNYVRQSGLFWHFRFMKLESCYFFQIHTLFKFTFYPFNHSAFRKMADLMHFIRWIEPKLKRPSALRTVGTRRDGGHWLPPILADLLTLLNSGGTSLVLFLPHLDFQTFLRPWLCKILLSDSEWGCPPKINCTSSWIHLWSAVLICQGFSSSGFHKRFREG